MQQNCSKDFNIVAWQLWHGTASLTGVKQDTLFFDEEEAGKCITECEKAIANWLSSTGEALIG